MEQKLVRRPSLFCTSIQLVNEPVSVSLLLIYLCDPLSPIIKVRILFDLHLSSSKAIKFICNLSHW